MKTRRLGRFDVSVVGLGCNNFGMRCDEKQTEAVVDAAIDSGINFFDTADVYGGTLSEQYLGKAIGSRRDDVILATKFGNRVTEMVGKEFKQIEDSGGGSLKWITRAVEDSLRRLSTDRIDLYQMHIPAGDVPIQETLEALTRLVKEGKVVEIGCSNFRGDQIEESIKVSQDGGLAEWVSAQNHYNLLYRQVEAEVIPACERLHLGMLPYFPLASGVLTGKYVRGAPLPEGTRLAAMPKERTERFLSDRNFDVIEKLAKFAIERGHTLLELAISWLAAKPAVASVIAGATKPEQVRSNVAAASWDLTKEEVEEIDSISRPD